MDANGVGEHDARIAQQPAPVSGVMAAFAQVDAQVEIQRAARAQKNRRPPGLQARAVGGDQHVGGEQLLVLLAEFPQSRRAELFARLDQHLEIETQPAARA